MEHRVTRSGEGCIGLQGITRGDPRGFLSLRYPDMGDHSARKMR